MKWIARYVAYLAFGLAAAMFWLVFAMVVFGFMPLPGDPACHFEPQGCPNPSLLKQSLGIVCFLGSFPLTVYAFVPFRKAVRRGLGLPENRSSIT